jgi:mono/diheme cytochrome c family protein
MRSGKSLTIGAAVLLLISPLSASAQTVKQENAPVLQSNAGIDTYKAYCAACHGEKMKGDGPAAPALKTKPTDLTMLAKNHGGKFSANDVQATIMGDQVIASHGSRTMPIWGPVFQAVSQDTKFEKLRVTNLIDYIKSAQAQ